MLGLVATALCAMVGVGVNIMPFMVQRSHPGVGPLVPLAYVLAAVPAVLAAVCYALLATAMPRAGGSYVHVTRALNPYAGFLASFAQWFGLSMGMGVVAYFLVPVLRDLLAAAGAAEIGPLFDRPLIRVPLSLGVIWFAWWVNLIGVKTYERTVVIMAALTIVGPIIMTIAGMLHTPEDFARALAARGIAPPPEAPLPPFSLGAFFGSCVVLFASFIGFDAISQAGGEARDARDLARSIVIAMAGVTLYYVTFTWSIYHAVPWSHIYREALVHDISAPGLLSPLLSPWLGLVILGAVAVAIIKVLPAVILANSRTLYAFSTDRILPEALARVHPRYGTPDRALTMTAVAASLSVLGCNIAGDFFLGVDLLVGSMLVNFVLLACAVIAFPYVNPRLYREVRLVMTRPAQVAIASLAVIFLTALLVVQVVGDLRSPTAWYLKFTTNWLMVMSAASLVFARFWRRLRRQGVDPRATIFSALPRE